MSSRYLVLAQIQKVFIEATIFTFMNDENCEWISNLLVKHLLSLHLSSDSRIYKNNVFKFYIVPYEIETISF